MTSREATPSRSISASALASWAFAAINTDLPWSSRRRPDKTVPFLISLKATECPASRNNEPREARDAAIWARNDRRSVWAMFIEPDEITECDREISFLGRSEGVSPEFVLE